MSHCKELNEYHQFTGPAEHHKAVNNFLGILEGISIDGIIDQNEVQELKNWYSLYRELIDRHPFNEILPAVDAALADNVITCEEVKDLRWLCQQVTSKRYYDLITSVIQSFHGLIHGLLADNYLSDDEIHALMEWLDDHSILKGTYPFDEVYSLVSAVTEDGSITEDERNMLKAFFAEFVDIKDSYNLSEPELKDLKDHYSIQGICARSPDVFIQGHTFCFTGTSCRATRNEIAAIIAEHGGMFGNSVNKKTEYLIVGADGNPCWAFSCYGRKIEKAVSMRKDGSTIIILNEHDFWSALEAL